MGFQIYRAKETELIEGCQRHDRVAQQALYRTYSGKMYSLCHRYVKDRMEAEDVLVASFTKIFEKIGQFKGEGSFEGWIRRVVVNESLTYLRRNKNMYLEMDIEAAAYEPDYHKLDTQLEADDLMKMIEELPVGYRTVFNMYAIDGFSHQEIADQLGISENTSKSQLSRARALLQKKLTEIEKELIQKRIDMENKIDQFFKDKLESHVTVPSEEAWAKVEANLSKKNNVVVWRIAAAILITGALVSVIILSQRSTNNNEQLVASKKSSKDNSIKETPASEVSSIEKKGEAKSVQKKSTTALPPSVLLPESVSSQAKDNSNQKKQETKTESVTTQASVEETILAASESKQEEKINSKATPTSSIASTKKKSIKLEFTLEDFSEEQPVATVNEEKNSGLKKVWDLAREVKNGDRPVHEMKNELFAHNFKKNKSQQVMKKN